MPLLGFSLGVGDSNAIGAERSLGTYVLFGVWKKKKNNISTGKEKELKINETVCPTPNVDIQQSLARPLGSTMRGVRSGPVRSKLDQPSPAQLVGTLLSRAELSRVESSTQ